MLNEERACPSGFSLRIVCESNKMTSLAGVDPTAETGVTGGVENTMQMEPSAEMRESKSEKSSELDHTNIGMSMDVLTRQFIYQGTYQWSTSDAPGTVIATFPIHPDSCNQYTAHVYKMFGAYVGGMKARMRIIGTAFYGGGIYMVRIPPQYKPSEIAQFGLAGMTAFPHTDVDPKNLDSVDILLEDFRSEHFHTGPLDTNDPKSFGGWLALVVNARLVTQTAEIRSLDLRMEFAGDFQFQVPVPIRTGATNSTGPLLTLHIPDLAGCDDAIACPNTTRLTVLKNTYKKALIGNLFHQRAGGKYLYDETNSDILNVGSAKWQTISDLRDANDEGRLVRSVDNYYVEDKEGWVACTAGQNRFMPVNYCTDVSFTCGWSMVTYRKIPDGKIDMQTERLNSHANPQEGSFELGRFGAKGFVPEQGSHTLFAPTEGEDEAPGFDNGLQIITPRREDRWIGDESYVVIGSNYGGSINTQAMAWARELAAFREWPVGSAAIYNVFNRSSNLIAVLKLRENGHFYAVGTGTSYVIKGAYRLSFRQWLPETDPLPIVTMTQRFMTNAATKAAVNDAVTRFTTSISALRLQKPAQ